MTFTDRASFLAALGSPATTEDYETSDSAGCERLDPGRFSLYPTYDDAVVIRQSCRKALAARRWEEPSRCSCAIAGSVSLAPGTTVNVGNTAAAPVPVQEVGGTSQLSRGFGGCFFASSVCVIDLATVPVGYRLVIEHISGNINVFDDTVAEITVGHGFGTCCLASNDNYLVPVRMGGSNRLALNHQTLMFFDGGATVRVIIEKGSGSPSVGAANFAYAGRLIPN